ncbi:MAG: hypothetical protein V4616_10085 [Bacteroidota bacterium]
MKKQLIISAFLVAVCCLDSVGQDPESDRSMANTHKKEYQAAKQKERAERKAQLEAQRSAYITTRLGLTTEQAREFWPVYNQYHAELVATKKLQVKKFFKKVKVMKEGKEAEMKVIILKDDWTDAQYKETMESRFKMEEEKLKVERRYYQEFQKVLSVKQLSRLYESEEEFKREILRELKKR